MPNFTQVNSPSCGPPLGLCGKSSLASRKAFTTAKNARVTGGVARFQQKADALLYLPVGIEYHLALCVVKQSDRERDMQFTAARFVQQAATHAGLHHVQFGFAHGAFQS